MSEQFWVVLTLLGIVGVSLALLSKRRQHPANICPKCCADMETYRCIDEHEFYGCPECGETVERTPHD